MVLDADVVVVFMAVDDFRQTLRLNVRTPGGGIQGLHDDHVAAVAALGEQAAGRRIGLEGRDDLWVDGCEFEEEL